MIGGLDKGCEVKWREGSADIVRHLLINLDDELEGKTIRKSSVIFKDLKCSINKNICWSVWVRCPPLGHTQTAQCSIGPVALSSRTVQIQVKLSVQLLQYHGLTASL